MTAVCASLHGVLDRHRLDSAHRRAVAPRDRPGDLDSVHATNKFGEEADDFHTGQRCAEAEVLTGPEVTRRVLAHRIELERVREHILVVVRCLEGDEYPLALLSCLCNSIHGLNGSDIVDRYVWMPRISNIPIAVRSLAHE